MEAPIEGWRLTGDGSIERPDGSMAWFSIPRFAKDICEAGHCFVCGKSPSDVAFNDEHVIPRWLLRRHELFDLQITLPNSKYLRYRSYTVPCCVACNSLLGRDVEEPIRNLVESGYEAVRRHLIDEGPRLLFCWMALLFLKTHLKDRQLHWHLDRRKGEIRIGDAYEWESLHHIHCLARSLIQPSILTSDAIGSVLCIRPAPEEDAQFDYGDVLEPKTVLLRTGDVALLCVLNDACGAWTFFQPVFARLAQLPHSLQLREMAAHLAFLNVCLKDRPSFHTSFLPTGEQIISATVPSVAELRPGGDGEFGALLWHFCAGPLVGSPEWDKIQEPLREGRYSFLVDRDGRPIAAPE
jgi:hypothetical protein